MISKKQILNLNGNLSKCEIVVYDETDKPALADIYAGYRYICEKCRAMGYRSINLPEALSEPAFCINTGAVRIKKAPSKFSKAMDCYNINTDTTIELKSSAILKDLSSFSPKIRADKLYFMDFYKQGKWDGTFDVYEISYEDILDISVNKEQTVRDQQNEKRRPRFSIKEKIIEIEELKPVLTGSVYGKIKVYYRAKNNPGINLFNNIRFGKSKKISLTK